MRLEMDAELNGITGVKNGSNRVVELDCSGAASKFNVNHNWSTSSKLILAFCLNNKTLISLVYHRKKIEKDEHTLVYYNRY